MKAIIVLTFLGISAYYDENQTRIPNILTYTMIGTGALYTVLQLAAHENQVNIAAKIIVTLLIFIIASVTKLMGGGDTKLLMGLCMWTSPMAVIQVFLMANLAVGITFIKKYIFAVKTQIKRALHGEFKGGKYMSAGRVPMAPAFFLMYAAYIMCPVTKLFSF